MLEHLPLSLEKYKVKLTQKMQMQLLNDGNIFHFLRSS